LKSGRSHFIQQKNVQITDLQNLGDKFTSCQLSRSRQQLFAFHPQGEQSSAKYPKLTNQKELLTAR
jgi:hypothetical protein